MRIDTRWFAFLILAACIAVGPNIAQAQCDVESVLGDSDKLAGLDLFYHMNCMGGEADSSPVTRAVLSGLTKIDALSREGPAKTLGNRTEAELAKRRDQMLDLLALVEGSLTGKIGDMTGPWRSYAEIVLAEMKTARAEIADFGSTMSAEYWAREQDYGFFQGATTGEYLISYEKDIDDACATDATPSECRENVESAIVLTRHIRLVERILDIEVRRRLEQIHTELVKLDEEWGYYFNDARSQYWWEFIANNAIYNPPPDKLSRPPSGQLILFHPSAAVERVDGNDMIQDTLNPVGTIEVIGYNQLRWTEDGPISRWPLGLSVIATWTPETDGDDFGYGLMLHIKNDYSIAATRRDTGAGQETTLLFSVDLTKLFLAKSEEARQWFRQQK